MCSSPSADYAREQKRKSYLWCYTLSKFEGSERVEKTEDHFEAVKIEVPGYKITAVFMRKTLQTLD